MHMHHRHIIRHQYVEIQYNGNEAGGKALQQKILDLCHHQWQACIEKSLDALDLSDHYIVLDSLELDLGETNLDSLEDLLTVRIQEQLHAQLPHHAGYEKEAHIMQNNTSRSISPSTHAFESLLFFLSHGYLPWNVKLNPKQSFEAWITSKWIPQEMASLKWDEFKAILSYPHSRTRLKYQFSENFIETVLNAIITSELGPLSTPLTIGQKWELVLPALLQGKKTTKSGKTSKPKADLREKREIEKQNTRIKSQWTETGESVYIENSGLVLLHPFLVRMFEGLQIASDNKITNPERALAILHYLATGQTSAPEYTLVLPKILCGTAISDEVLPPYELSGQDIEEAAGMLGAVITHWSALRDTSADALRSTFLLRPGRITETSDGEWVLEVETKSFDVLIGFMPWGFSRIQLPWMEKMLHVQWDYQQLM